MTGYPSMVTIQAMPPRNPPWIALIVLVLSSALVSMGLTGCQALDQPGDIGSLGQRVMDEALSANALSANALSANALSANALSANALSANALSANALSANGLLDTDDGLALAEYMVRCALPQGESIVVTVDDTRYPLEGLLGMAPQWRHSHLSRNAQEWVSACLLAHVNAFEISVAISVRGAGPRSNQMLVANNDERAGYPVYEASFFGNIFDTAQPMYACWGDNPLRAHLMAPDRTLRRCSDPMEPGYNTLCGFIALGMCSRVCAERHPRAEAWRECQGSSGETYNATLGAWLESHASSPAPVVESGDESDND